MNIFQRIGNNIEKEKKEIKKFNDRYWKLSSSERIDYEIQSDKIKKNDYFFEMTFLYAKFLLIFLFVSVALMIINKNFISLIKPLFNSLRLLPFPFVIDFGLTILISKSQIKKKKELNKRFKLC